MNAPLTPSQAEAFAEYVQGLDEQARQLLLEETSRCNNYRNCEGLAVVCDVDDLDNCWCQICLDEHRYQGAAPRRLTTWAGPANVAS